MVVKGDGPNLLGYYISSTATLDIDLFQVQLLKIKYKQVFAEGLGIIKKFKAHLHVKSDAKPLFHRLKAVPYVIRDIIEKELKKLEKKGIIEIANGLHLLCPY